MDDPTGFSLADLLGAWRGADMDQAHGAPRSNARMWYLRRPISRSRAASREMRGMLSGFS